MEVIITDILSMIQLPKIMFNSKFKGLLTLLINKMQQLLGLSDLSGAISTVSTSDLTANRALISNDSGKIDVSSVTSTQLGYVSGVTSAIQTQLNNKAALDSPTFTGIPKAPTASAGTNTTQIATTAYVYTAINGHLMSVFIRIPMESEQRWVQPLFLILGILLQNMTQPLLVIQRMILFLLG